MGGDYYMAPIVGDGFSTNIYEDPCTLATLDGGCYLYENVGFDVVFAATSVGKPYSFALFEIPEPETWAMMLIGLAACGAVLRRRRAVVAT